MKRSPIREAKEWLLARGWYPKSVIGRFTVYLGLIELAIWLVRRAIKLGNPKSDFAGSWLYFLTLALGVCALIWLFQWIRRTLMWRLRNRLLVTYAFIGFAPVVLLLAMFLAAGWLFVGQYAAYLATNDFKSELHRLTASNNTLMGGAKVLVRANKLSEGARDLVDREIGNRDFPMRHVSLWFRGKEYVLQGQPNDPSMPVPDYVHDGFEAMVLDHGVYLRSVSRQRVGDDDLVMVSSLPLRKEELAGIAKDLGYVWILPPTEEGLNWKNSAAGKPSSAKDDDANITVNADGKGFQVKQEGMAMDHAIEAGEIPAPSPSLDLNLLLTTLNLDLKLPFGTFPTFTIWANGKTNTGALGVQTRLSQLYRRLFESVGKNASMFITALIAIAVFIAIIELIALFIGLRLTRTITRSVAELYIATEYVNKGDFHHRIQIKSKDQLAALESSFNSMTTSIEALIIEQKEKQKMESELAIAQEVQALLFPQATSEMESLELHGVCRPARTVSGDYYDFLQLGQNQIGLAVGDISGKGISAALLMATVHAFVRAYTIEEALTEAKVGTAAGANTIVVPQTGEHLPPATLLALLNEQLFRSTPASKYATMFLGFYDGHRRRLTYSNAGHLPPFVISSDGSYRKLGDGGMVVGLFGGVSYENDFVDMQSGDIIVAYSDGVTEPENEFGEFGEDRLAQIVREHSGLPLPRIADAVITAVTDWIGGAEQPDDITVVLARAR
ncbi:MAG TPA: SpoIIE family protein phosphatase [Candidatus Koribacter sp.]|jgi:sigma-B regulation protein RsbU (phosphoserine phosphatase)